MTGKYRLWDVLYAADVTPGQYYYWQRKGATLRAVGRGRHAYYTRDHIERLREIKRTKDLNCTIVDIIDRIVHPEPDDPDE